MNIKKYPEFTKLTTSDKTTYEDLIKYFPPISDIAFPTLFIWWDALNDSILSEHNGNLIIRYKVKDDPLNSGISVIGNKNVDQTINYIFDDLRKKDISPQLVHVPQLTINHITNKELYNISAELDYREYILDAFSLSQLSSSTQAKNRRKIGKFLRTVEGRKIHEKTLDLSIDKNRELLIKKTLEWFEVYGLKNDKQGDELAAINKTITLNQELGMQNITIWIDDDLYGYALFQAPGYAKQYIIANHIRVDYSIKRIFEYVTHRLATWATEHHKQFINIEMDLGIEGLHVHKQGLRPVNFFNKYRIEPK